MCLSHRGGVWNSPVEAESRGKLTRMNTDAQIRQLLRERILIIDGAMGTLLQGYKLGEQEYRGDRFADHPVDLKNNTEVLNLIRPEIVEACHLAYLEAGADIIETNTFTANGIAQSDYQLSHLCYEMNL